MMFEQQRKLETDKSKASSSQLEDPSNEKSEQPEQDLARTGTKNNTGNAKNGLEESVQSSSRKQKAPETRTSEDIEQSNAKRARLSEPGEHPAKSASE